MKSIIHKKFRIHYQTPSTFSAMLFRYLWADLKKKITKKTNTLFVFVDEAIALLGKNKTRAREFYSIVPLVNKPISTKKMSILAAVIQGFGICYKWFTGSVKGYHYARFIREIAFICRTRKCNPSTQIVVIQDNFPIHKTSEFIIEAQRSRLKKTTIINN